MLSRCCFHYLVENLILYLKKDIQHFYIGLMLLSQSKIIRLAIDEKIESKTENYNNLVPGGKG